MVGAIVRTVKTPADRSPQVSSAQLAANRSNAQLSTGPRSETGKRVASVNAVKTGLTGRTVLLPSDDAAAYQQHVESFFRDHDPQDERQYEIVQSLADTRWRLDRIPALEMAILARGRVQFAEQFSEFDPNTAAMLVDAETAIVYERQLRNLQLQERRLRRQYQDILLELHQAKSLRTLRSSKYKPVPEKVAKPLILPSNGFEFSKTLPEPGKGTAELSSQGMKQELESSNSLKSLLPGKNRAA